MEKAMVLRGTDQEIDREHAPGKIDRDPDREVGNVEGVGIEVIVVRGLEADQGVRIRKKMEAPIQMERKTSLTIRKMLVTHATKRMMID